MKIKIFFSYSRCQRDFLDQVLSNLGHDYAVVDNYTLEDGEVLWDELEKAIEDCTHFVFLMSPESLQSNWCQKELDHVRNMYDCQEIKFLPFIIDDKVDIENLGRKRWIKNHVTNHVYKPAMLTRLLKQKIRRDIWEIFPEFEKKYQLFIGRDEEIAEIVRDFYDNDDTTKKAIILSGVPHTGRRRILREFIQRIVSSQPNNFSTIDIKLKDNDDLSDFVLQLNDIAELYEYEYLLPQLQKGRQFCLSFAITLLNEIHKKHFNIVIEDDKCIVMGNGKLTTWFLDIVKHKDLSPHMHLCVASKYTPLSNISLNFPEILSYQVSALDRSKMRTLFNAYASIREVIINSSDTETFLDLISVYPEHAFFAIESAKKSIIKIALAQTRNRVKLFDDNFVELISEIQKEESLYTTLLTLSLFEFISFDTLCEILNKDCSNEIESLYHYSILEFFGTNRQYLCLNHAFGEYLRRMRVKLPSNIISLIRKRTKEIFNSMNDHLPDMSWRLYATKELIREGGAKIDERYLLPSLVLKVVTEEYYEGHDNNVIILCNKLLSGYKQNQYEEIMRSIHYWLCCSLCRRIDPQFLKEIQYFDDESYSYYFLFGFYWRHKHDYIKAEQYYDEALQRKHYSEESSYISKAQHEMVIVQTHLGHYQKALELAEDSYQHDNKNTYHIESYFRCLVRSASPSKDILRNLIQEMKDSQDVHRDVISNTLEAEYEYYIHRNFQKAYEIIIKLLGNTDDTYHNYPLRSLREICKDQDNLKLYKTILKQYSIKENCYFDEPD